MSMFHNITYCYSNVFLIPHCFRTIGCISKPRYFFNSYSSLFKVITSGAIFIFNKNEQPGHFKESLNNRTLSDYVI